MMESKRSESWRKYFRWIDFAYSREYENLLTKRQIDMAKKNVEYYQFEIIYFNLTGII